MYNAVNWEKADSATYPNITVCQRSFFDSNKLKCEDLLCSVGKHAKLSSLFLAHNISDKLANYLLIMVDPGYHNYYTAMASNPTLFGTFFKNSIAAEAAELDKALARLNSTAEQLFHKLAIE